MVRKLRIDYQGAWHHVMNRGARHKPIFKLDGHCWLFLVTPYSPEAVREPPYERDLIFCGKGRIQDSPLQTFFLMIIATRLYEQERRGRSGAFDALG